MSSCYAYQCMRHLLVTPFKYSLSFNVVESVLCKVSLLESYNKMTTTQLCAACRLRDHAQPHSLHLDAKPLQPYISRGRARDVLHIEGKRACLWYIASLSNSLQMFGVGSTPWSPLGRGLLTRPVRDQSKRGETDWYVFEKMLMVK